MKILKYTGITVLSILTLVLIYVAIILSSGASNTLELLKTNLEKSTLEIDSSYNHPKFDSLVKQISYKSALAILAADDSIQIAINLKDSVVSLFINGVPILDSKMTNLKKDKLLQNLQNDLYYGLFAKPIDVVNIRTTIVKEPIVEVEAPKNEDEAAQNAYMPDTLIQFPAFLHLTLTNGIELFFDQDSVDTDDEKNSKALFMNEHKKKRKESLVNSLTKGSTYYYEPLIQIELPIDDLRAIYRAVPSKIKIVLYID
jgi:hypothetical protein